MHEEQVIVPAAGVNLRGIVHYPEATPRGCIITCHGLFSSKDSEKFVALGELFAREQYVLLRFDFRGCGESDGILEDTTIRGRIEDLRAAITFMQRRLPSATCNTGILGSSLGGSVALHVAPGYPAVKAVATWAAPFSLEGVHTGITRETRPRLKEPFFTDASWYTLKHCVPRVNNLLVIHGEDDEMVPVEHARLLYRAANEPKLLEIIAGADHVFSSQDHRERAARISLDWFKQHLA